MTVKSGFFSDGSSYNQADFNAFLLDSIGSGYVLGYGNELAVSVNTPANMGVYVKTGRCYVQGYYGWVTANEALTVPTANATYPRIDRVVARLSVSVNQSVTFAVLTGTPAASPTAPTLTRTSETYEISLCQIAVGAGVTSIVAGDITDERADSTLCGVAGVKHSWSYLNNVVIDVSEMSVDAGVSDRDPVYFNGTKWVVATSGAVGFYDDANDAVITAGYLDGFTGLTPGAIVGYRGVALTATEIVVLETPIDGSGVKHVGAVTGTFTGDLTGLIKHVYSIKTTPGVFNLGTVITAFSGTGTGTSTSGTITTGLIARIAGFTATNPAFAIFDNLGTTLPFNISVNFSYNGADGHYAVTTKDISGNVIATQTYIDEDNTGHTFTVAITALTDSVTYTIYGPYSTEYSCSAAAYYAGFD